MRHNAHVLIAGGGIGGLAAALALSQVGACVEIFEQSSHVSEIGAGLQLGPNALHVLEALSALDAIKAAAFAPEAIALRHHKTGKAMLYSPLGSACKARYGQTYLHIHRADLHRILLRAAKAAGAIIHLGHKIESASQTEENVSVSCGGKAYSGDILIGSDGIHSKIREQLLGPEKPRFTGQVAWRGLVSAKAVSPDLIPPCANNWMGPGRHFVSYYVRGGDMINFVAVEERDKWTEENWSQPGNIDELRTAFSGWDSRITDLLSACETCYLWGLFDRPPLPDWVQGRIALLGDAAHPMLPFLAQGAAMAIEDAWVLAQAVSNHASPHPALQSYSQSRQPRANYIQALSQKNASLYHTQTPWGRIARRTKFKIAAHAPGLVARKFDPIFGVNVTRD